MVREIAIHNKIGYLPLSGLLNNAKDNEHDIVSLMTMDVTILNTEECAPQVGIMTRADTLKLITLAHIGSRVVRDDNIFQNLSRICVSTFVAKRSMI